MNMPAASCLKISALLLLCLAPAWVAAQGSSPDAPSSGAPQASVDAATLKRYSGYYQLGDIQGIMTVAVVGTELTTQVTGQPAVHLAAQTPTHFSQQGTQATIDFVTDGHAPATALILHQGGRDTTLPRMNDALATRFNAEFAARIRANTPRRGSQAAAQDFFARLEKGQPPDYAQMTPELAALTTQVQSDLLEGVASLGALQSITFQKVDPTGVDVYLVKFLNGSVELHLNMDSKGVITGLLLQRSP